MTRSFIAQGRRLRQEEPPRGFTMVELMVVMVIIAILLALLLPAITGALRNGRNAAVSAEISQMSQALAQFKNTNGVYPPSRIYLNKRGDFSVPTIVAQTGLSPAAAQILSQRSITYLRRIWPRMTLYTDANQIPNPPPFYDFDGTGLATFFVYNFSTQQKVAVPGLVLQGPECLAFFLGGIPQATDATTTVGPLGQVFSVVGFGKNPVNPMQNAVVTSNRSSPLFEFRPGRLVDFDGNGFPEYLDGLGGSSQRPFVYFSAYEGQGYDPDDNDYIDYLGTGFVFLDADDISDGFTTGVFGGFSTPNAPTATRVYNAQLRPDIVASKAPNPYVADVPLPIDANGNIDPTNHKPREYVNKISYQLFSAGADNDFGIGGQFDANSTGQSLPFPAVAESQATGGQPLPTTIRQRERDNLTNFKNGTLQ